MKPARPSFLFLFSRPALYRQISSCFDSPKWILPSENRLCCIRKSLSSNGDSYGTPTHRTKKKTTIPNTRSTMTISFRPSPKCFRLSRCRRPFLNRKYDLICSPAPAGKSRHEEYDPLPYQKYKNIPPYPIFRFLWPTPGLRQEHTDEVIFPRFRFVFTQSWMVPQTHVDE